METTAALTFDGVQRLLEKVRAEFDAKLERLEVKFAGVASDVTGVASTTPLSGGAVVSSLSADGASSLSSCDAPLSDLLVTRSDAATFYVDDKVRLHGLAAASLN